MGRCGGERVYTSTAAGEAVPPVRRFDVVGVASSAGGIKALSELLGWFQADLSVPLLVVQHLDRHHRTTLADVLGRRSDLVVKLAEAGEVIRPGAVYLAPPDHHLLVTPAGVLALTNSKLVHFVRPSADLLFESVAGAYGDRAIACVLTGSGSDGAMGVTAVKACGGVVIAQDPRSAEFSGMPEAAVRTGAVDFVLPLEKIGQVILDLLRVGAA